MLTCPHCERPLTRDGQVFRCQQGHAFDLAREGYVNLLRRPSKLPSDTKDMLMARRRFLARGYYQPLAEAISATVRDWLPAHGNGGQVEGGILDAGCGEGYFTRAVAQVVADTFPERQVYGVDLSRDAVRLAGVARPAPDGATPAIREPVWAVSNIRERLPFADASMAAIINVFAPHNAQEFGRLLQPAGLLLMIVPDAQHLAEARDPLRLLTIQPDKRSHLLAQVGDHFSLAKEQSLTYEMTLDAMAQDDLRRMTPQKPIGRGAPATEITPLESGAPTLLVTRAAFLLFALERRIL